MTCPICEPGHPCAAHRPPAESHDCYSLFPPFSDRDTSLEAAVSVQETTKGMRQKVLNYLRGADDGATCDEVEKALDMPHQTASARLWELRKLGLATDATGDRRPTRSGRKARVWYTECVSEDEID